MSKLMAAVVMVWVSMPALAEDWVPYRLSPDKAGEPGVKWEIDKDSLRYDGERVRYWLRITTDKPQIMRSDTYPRCKDKAVIALYSEQESDCAARKISLVGAKMLCEGNVLVDDPGPVQTTPSIPPGLDTGDAFTYCKKWYEVWK